jgi:hypothetical protein
VTATKETSARGFGSVRDSGRVIPVLVSALAFAALYFSFLTLAAPAQAVQSPINLTPPTLSGTSTVGQTVSVTSGTWDADPAVDPATGYTYEWQRRDRNTGLWGAIPGAANQNTYTLGVDDYDTFVRALVSASNGEEPPGESLSNTTFRIRGIQPFNTGSDGTALPTLDDSTPTIDSSVGIDVGTWGGVPEQNGDPLGAGAAMTYTYQWYRCPSATSTVPGDCTALSETSASYTPVTVDFEKYIAARVIADNNTAAPVTDTGTAYTTTYLVDGVPPSIAVAPAVTGTTTVYEQLATNDGTWNGNPPQFGTAPLDMTFTYEWLRCDDATLVYCTTIPGETGDTYDLVAADYNKYIRSRVTADNDQLPDGVAESAPAGPVAGTAPVATNAPTITGTKKVQQEVTATDGTWGPAGEPPVPTETYT